MKGLVGAHLQGNTQEGLVEECSDLWVPVRVVTAHVLPKLCPRTGIMYAVDKSIALYRFRAGIV